MSSLVHLLPAALLACGDDGRATAGESATSTASTAPTSTTATTDVLPTGGQSESATDSDAGSISDSAATGSTGATGVSAGSSTTAPATTGDTTTGDTPFCGDAPPKGYMGMVNAACKTEPNIGTFTPVVEWSKQVFAVAPEYNQVMMTPVVAPLTDDDGDGVYGSDGDIPAVLYVTYAGNAYVDLGVLRAVSGDGQTELLSIVGQGIAASSGIAVGNVDDDLAPEIAVVGLGGTLKVFEHDGTPKWTSAAYPGDITYHQFAAPAIADLNADTLPEFIIGRVILNNDGTTRGVGMYGTGALIYGSTSFAADVDDDGTQEVIVGNAIYKDDGSHVWATMESDGYPAVADFDGDGGPEIVVVSPGEVRLQTAGGGLVWKVPNPAQVGGPPTIADFDGDGLPEVGVAGKTGYVVFDTDGTILWQKATQDASSAITGSSVYDFEGDGIADVVYADEVNLYVYSGIDGTTKLTYDGHNSGTLIEYPIVVDVDNDKQVEIVVVHNNLIESNYGITVVGDADKSWRPGRKIWNQHAYNITNVDDDGGIPAVPSANWKAYNNFRSGDLSANDGLAAPDLVSLTPESCLNECTGPDEVTIWVQLGNTGAAPLTAGADIEVYGTSAGVEMLIKTVPFDMVLQPGQFADGVGIPVISTGLDQIRVVAKPKEAECVVDPANEIVLMAPFCSIPG